MNDYFRLRLIMTSVVQNVKVNVHVTSRVQSVQGQEHQQH